ncbi:MAG: hypothetical protein U5R46_17765 [Gammaproteobacteria bacterium]|nr:hypothetical protein [Gammaproteobacteria bacterium]
MTKITVFLLAVLAWTTAPVQAQTHVNVPPQDLVVLSGDGFTYDPGGGSILNPSDFPNALRFTSRIRHDGTRVEDYRIPRGKVLVVTEVHWAFLTDQPDHTYCLVLSVGQNSPPSGADHNLSQTCLTTDGDGFGSVSKSFTTGFVVHRNEQLYTSGPWDPRNGGPAGGDYMGRPDGQDVLVRGYLVDERSGPGLDRGGRGGPDWRF